jgi:hypothetical protein
VVEELVERNADVVVGDAEEVNELVGVRSQAAWAREELEEHRPPAREARAEPLAASAVTQEPERHAQRELPRPGLERVVAEGGEVVDEETRLRHERRQLRYFGAIDASVGTFPWVKVGTGHRV